MKMINNAFTFSILFMAVLAIGGCSKSNPASGDVPLPPTELSGQPTGAFSVQLEWKDNSANETGFVIYRKIAGPFEEVGQTQADRISFQDIIQQSCVEASYYVLAINKNGESTASNRITVQMLCGE